jgi:hypothetical protein
MIPGNFIAAKIHTDLGNYSQLDIGTLIRTVLESEYHSTPENVIS